MRAGIPSQSFGGGHHVNASWFGIFANKTAQMTGKPATFLIATLVVVVWAATGPIFKYSDTWQLVINTGTTIVTFLMVFLIQATQNRDTLALQVKLDELILATSGAHNEIAAIEEETEDTLEAAKNTVRERARTAPKS
jgi:low affinity Fe/Cu permease